jgi:drug/metabolite transporter (DMT)-like permease
MLIAPTAWALVGEALPTARLDGDCRDLHRRGRAGTATRRTGQADKARLALANAVVIAAYTLNDALGVRISGTPLAYTLWLFPLSAVPTLLWLHRGGQPRQPSWREALRGLGGTGCVIAAYALVPWAMTRAPIAPVAALRETAILFGVVLARFLLGERPGRWGWGGALTIATGAVMLRLA